MQVSTGHDLTGLESMPPGPQLAVFLGSVDPASVSDFDLVELIAAFERQAAWDVAGQVTAIAELARRPAFTGAAAAHEAGLDAHRLAGLEIGARLRLSPSTADQQVRVACQLARDLPATLAALRKGHIDYRRAAALADGVHALPVEQARAVEAIVLTKAGERTVSRHRAAIARAVLAVDPAGAEERHQRAVADRRVDFIPRPDGMAELWALLPADDAAALRAALDAAAAGMKAGRPDDVRTVDQRRADALAAMGHLALATGHLGGIPDAQRLGSAHGRRAQIQVTVPFSTLIGLDDQPAELAGHGPIPASVARRIAAHGTWRRLLTDPRSGALLDYGRTRYEPPQDLIDHVVARDRWCVFVGCGQPAHRCQLDHTIRYPAGATSATNLAPLHGSHHNGKTHAGWHLEQPEPGRFRWTSPTGHVYTVDPEPLGPVIEPPPDSDLDGPATETPNGTDGGDPAGPGG